MLLSLSLMPILKVKQLVIPMAIELTGMPLGEVVNQPLQIVGLDQRVQGELLTLERKDLKLASGLGRSIYTCIWIFICNRRNWKGCLARC